ncbi:hypothetical protein Kpol_541p28 [Vanderwaltozyma polyspora DSM 70294]|uniref:Uncharacterized protein n=1 Tax=Vanderwaltozyma polyspora (strain ATCC 22028 / DSM 70294 / BCRC 21397 / CBS 2163 / NBRC 10782 / NRRL Y-8283 / UCD 57-17) TaxID=436907 RepID=A7TIX3_VANPO|nr:uncharacterized protein Kpol_541p28 [Vanderwaltozyma polyspora DSM 70294]EDO17785.1 hypothetical protein Kpol_541p28 [Vanderwaltozyma polyspora DSM 70294]
MAQTIEIIKKKIKHSKKADPLAKQKLWWTIGHTVSFVLGVLFSITYFYHVLFFYKYRQWKWLFLRLDRTYQFIPGNTWTATIINFLPHIFYRFSLIGFVLSGSISLYQSWAGVSPSWYDLFGSGNFLAIFLAAVWALVGRKSFYRLFPFMSLSYMHLMNRDSEIENNIKEEEKATLRNAKILSMISYSEYLVAVALFFDTILLKDGTSGFLAVIYYGLFWIRLNFVMSAQVTALQVLEKIEKYTPEKHKHKLQIVEDFLYSKMKKCQNMTMN